MEKSFIFEYLDENNFKKRERSVRKYNMLAYKKLTFEYYPTIRSGKFLGKKISEDKTAKTESYELKLPTDESFAKVHGEIIVHYTVYLGSQFQSSNLSNKLNIFIIFSFKYFLSFNHIGFQKITLCRTIISQLIVTLPHS